MGGFSRYEYKIYNRLGKLVHFGSEFSEALAKAEVRQYMHDNGKGFTYTIEKK